MVEFISKYSRYKNDLTATYSFRWPYFFLFLCLISFRFLPFAIVNYFSVCACLCAHLELLIVRKSTELLPGCLFAIIGQLAWARRSGEAPETPPETEFQFSKQNDDDF